MRADGGGDVDEEGRFGLMRGVALPKGAGALFGVGVQNGDLVELTEVLQPFEQMLVGNAGRANCTDIFDLPFVEMDDGFDLEQAAEPRLCPRDASATPQIFEGVENRDQGEFLAEVGEVCGDVFEGFPCCDLLGNLDDLKANPEAELLTVDDLNAPLEGLGGETGGVDNSAQAGGGVDGYDFFCAFGEETLVTRGKSPCGGGCSGGGCLHRGHPLVEVAAADVDAVEVAFPFDDESDGDDLDLVGFADVSGEVGGAVGDKSCFHGRGGMERGLNGFDGFTRVFL